MLFEDILYANNEFVRDINPLLVWLRAQFVLIGAVER